MKKAVIQTGSKQYIVSEGDTLTVEKLVEAKKIDFKPLLVIDGNKVSVGMPIVEAFKVSADVIEADKLADKTTSIRYKAKKRVHTVRGHRQHMSVLKITKIAEV
jgi:large subunit ribosomal protein L21